MHPELAKYSLAFLVIMGVGYMVQKYRQREQQDSEEHEMELIRKFLLNESPLYGYNKPKLWIHTKYELNSRVWKSFYSRNSMDLNQPYIHLCVKTLVNHCSNDFNICIIDDETFGRLIPSWNYTMSELPEPMKQRVRMYGLCYLVYIYGGMVVPNSFVCAKNLVNLFTMMTPDTKPFFVQQPNHSKTHDTLPLLPSLEFFGCKTKHSETLKNLMDWIKTTYLDDGHFHCEDEFLGTIPTYCQTLVHQGKFRLLGGEYVGLKKLSQRQELITLDHLMEEGFLDIPKEAFGVWIPQAEVLGRTKYQWFAYLSTQEILRSEMAISTYLIASIVETNQKFIQDQSSSSMIPSPIGSL